MKTLAIASMTFKEAIRHSSGLMTCFLLTLLMLSAPAFSTFAMSGGAELLRSNLLSTFMLGGVIYLSIISTSLFYKEISSGTILSLLSKPVSIPAYYLGKLLGIMCALILYFFILTTVGWMSTITGTPDTASTVYNFIPMLSLSFGLLALAILAGILNYILEFNIISFIFGGWFFLNPLILAFTYWLSPSLELPLPDHAIVIEFLKAAGMMLLLLIVICSFSVALSSFTGPLLNLVFCIIFLLLCLMSTGLQESLSSGEGAIHHTLALIPDFHLFWMAEMIHLKRLITWTYLIDGAAYALSLSAAFSCMGIFALLKRDYT
ncbi:MAG: hypothetical protein HQL32_07845 [Planctomycetes bacterium]|nr:hypothetical protein [Planctomycetota bacterium]